MLRGKRNASEATLLANQRCRGRDVGNVAEEALHRILCKVLVGFEGLNE